MLKFIFDKDVIFISNKIDAPKVETLRMARYIQILCLSTLNLINQRNVFHIKLSKYCDIDAHLSFPKKIPDYLLMKEIDRPPCSPLNTPISTWSVCLYFYLCL